ncbi:hypothetical protein BGW80DRAFT_1310706 [Lactifluus volemus]|nr:hypothetical protein BGW80DRAFT_1310706 [Lactifluus volemus]
MALPHTAFDILPGQFLTWNNLPVGSSVDLNTLLPLHIPSTSTLPFIIIGSSTSTLVSEWIPSPTTPFLEQGETALSQEDRNFAPRNSRREGRKYQPFPRRGPNKRRPGTGYVDMMENLPAEVQDALRTRYEGCCEVVKGKDVSTLQKHWFSKGHYKKLPSEYQDMLPVFTCPAFISLDSKCKKAKAGRYDSTDRHCKGCNGFSEVFSNIPASPLEVTIGEFKSIQAFRNNPESGKTDDETPSLVEAAVVKMVKMVMEGTGSDLEDIIFPPDLASEPQHPPAIAGTSIRMNKGPQTPQDAVESDPPSDFVETYHTTGDDPDQITPAGVVQYYDAPLNAPWDKWDIAWPLGM